jgi:hypothetical protein
MSNYAKCKTATVVTTAYIQKGIQALKSCRESSPAAIYGSYCSMHSTHFVTLIIISNFMLFEFLKDFTCFLTRWHDACVKQLKAVFSLATDCLTRFTVRYFMSWMQFSPGLQRSWWWTQKGGMTHCGTSLTMVNSIKR